MKKCLLVLGWVVAASACGDDDSAPLDGGLSDARPGDALTLDGGEGDAGPDAEADASIRDASSDASSDAGDDASDAFVSCLDEGRMAGERYPLGDRCNFCECNEDGTTTCTERTCLDSALGGCEYDGVMHDYAERFPASDACNECVCATSGLACTRRTETCPDTAEEGAILLETFDELCGGLAGFSPEGVLGDLPYDEIVVPFAYNRSRELYPETLPDTELTLRIVRDQGGYAVCRIPMPGQEAIDMEVLVEWFTADGAFDETFHAYLRRNATGFTNVWTIATSLPPGALNGTYDPDCFDFNGYGFGATIDFDRSAFGSAFKSCETDIALDIGSFSVEP